MLREALKESNKVGIAKVVIQTKQHLAVLIPCGPALVLNLLRWGGEIRSWEDLKLPPVGAKAAGLKDSELKMARQLIDDMAADWNADQFRDSFREEIMNLVQTKAKAGETETVTKVEDDPSPQRGADVIDLTELLKRSLQVGKAASGSAPAKKTPAKETGPRAAVKKAAGARSGTRRAA